MSEHQVTQKVADVIIAALEKLAVSKTQEDKVGKLTGEVIGTRVSYWGRRRKGHNSRLLATIEQIGDSQPEITPYPYAIIRESARPRNLVRGTAGSVKMLVKGCGYCVVQGMKFGAAMSRAIDEHGGTTFQVVDRLERRSSIKLVVENEEGV